MDTSDILTELCGIVFTKGHATGNDFLLFDDPSGALDISPQQVKALCDRRKGFGADGVIRVVRTAHSEMSSNDDRLNRLWLMDYRNADGSLAEMCGNGVRLFSHYLVTTHKVDPSLPFEVMTRAGVKTITARGDAFYEVDMGAPVVPGQASLGNESVTVTLPGIGEEHRGYCVDMPNPHTVVFLDDHTQLDAIIFPHTDPLLAPPALRPTQQPAAVNGTNYEAIVVNKEKAIIDMRVCERGVGETLSCGTGCCAVGVAASFTYGQPHIPWTVRVPGGELTIDTSRDTVFMTGPATLVGTCFIPIPGVDSPA
ncbi:MAG: diaminopimelate epimerase [Actinomycetaceae bacterium]|nr:diaminopimelate epimerase [Actinomycetaceae bacterium]